MTLSVLTERRVHCPPGLAGGSPGARGKNTLRKMDGRMISLGPKTAVPVHAGVRLESIFIIIVNFHGYSRDVVP